jgi:hypothetical protein
MEAVCFCISHLRIEHTGRLQSRILFQPFVSSISVSMKVFSSRSVQLVYSTDRRRVFVDLRIHIPEKLLQLNNEIRTVKATNNYDNLKFYLYFSEPILNSSAEILNSLNTSEGVLLPISGENLMNRKFGFQVNLCPRLICLS